MARDEITEIKDADAFGKEWQVLASEPNLFPDASDSPNRATECVMPSQTAAETRRKRRRLGEAMLDEDIATEACAHVELEMRDACIFDVLATNDKDMAGAY